MSQVRNEEVPMDHARDIRQALLKQFPESGRSELELRLDSPSHRRGAELELIVNSFFLQKGFNVKCEAELRRYGYSVTPDFIISLGSWRCIVDATYIPDHKDASELLLQLQVKAQKYGLFELPYIIFASYAPEIDSSQWEQFEKSLGTTLRLGICINLNEGSLETTMEGQTAGTLEDRVASILISGSHPILDGNSLSFPMKVTSISHSDNLRTYYALLDCLGELI